jgi:hypothetical protein
MAREISSFPLSVAIAIAGLAVGSSHCGSAAATSGADDASIASDGAAASDAGATSCATAGCPSGLLCCPAQGETCAPTCMSVASCPALGRPCLPGGDSGSPAEGASPGDGANGGPSGSDATSSPDGHPSDASPLDGGESRDAPQEPDGDAGMCTSNSDCASNQWCVEFVQTRGVIDITHTQCVTTTCASVDCSCAQSMCGSYNCSVNNGRLVCRDNGV